MAYRKIDFAKVKGFNDLYVFSSLLEDALKDYFKD